MITIKSKDQKKDTYRSKIDDADVVIGGENQTFSPGIYSSKWKNECWLNITHSDVDVSDSMLSNGKVSTNVNGTTREHEFYYDGTKWDIVYNSLDDLPKTLKEVFTLDYSDGLTFHYQPELTQEEIEDGHHRPDNVVGSYAVYYNKKDNEYATGKFCHIYRPLLIAADGARIWCDLDIKNKRLTITLPSSTWFDAHPAPWRLDPTVGYTTAGASSKDTAGYCYSTMITMPEAGDIETIHMSMASPDAASASAGVISDVSSTPDTLLEDSNEQTVPTTQGWVTFTLDSPYSASATNYHLAVHGENVSGNVYYYDLVDTHVNFRVFSGYTSGTVAIPNASYNSDYSISIYATYTTSGGGGSLSGSMGLLGVGY